PDSDPNPIPNPDPNPQIIFTNPDPDPNPKPCPSPTLPIMSLYRRATVVQEVEKSFSNQKVASSIPCRSILEQDTEPLIAPDVQCAISVNVKCVYIVSRTYVSRFG